MPQPIIHRAIDRLGLVKTFCGAEATIFNFSRNWATVTCKACLKTII